MNVNDLANAINAGLAQYGNEVGKIADEETLELAKEGVKWLRKNSPKDSGDYRKGWRIRKERSRRGRQREHMTYVIHNKTDYRLTHLLEKGHVTPDGTDRVPAYVHIKPVNDSILNEIESKLASAVGRR